MKDIIVTAITLGIIGAVARLILPCSKKFIACRGIMKAF